MVHALTHAQMLLHHMGKRACLHVHLMLAMFRIPHVYHNVMAALHSQQVGMCATSLACSSTTTVQSSYSAQMHAMGHIQCNQLSTIEVYVCQILHIVTIQT